LKHLHQIVASAVDAVRAQHRLAEAASNTNPTILDEEELEHVAAGAEPPPTGIIRGSSQAKK
jgi:hypothetical protein